MTEPRTRALDVLAPSLLKLGVSAFTLSTGFRAISDDDYARIVIAERFAASPSFDPSGTSWLPFPFWLTGAVMTVGGPSVEIARSVAFVLGILSIALVWWSARLIGASRRGALLGACIAAVFPYSAWTGVATVPELPTAALVLFAAASSTRTGAVRTWGGLAIALACLSRYEAWPVAALFVAKSVWDAARSRKWQGLAGAALALAAPLAWLAHGAARHGNALFFVQRVSEYRRAVGAGGSTLLEASIGYPWMLVRAEPELVALALIAVAAAFLTGTGVLRRHARVALAVAALLLFLIAGDLRDGAPTHHAERALLAVWLWLSVLAGDALSAAWAQLHAAKRALVIALAGLCIAPVAGIVRPWYARRDGFIDREHEVRIGMLAREKLGPTERLRVDSPDFGFYAVIAGFGAPERALPFDDRDPRKPRAADAFATPEQLQTNLVEARASWFVVTNPHLHVAEQIGHPVARAGQLALYRVGE